MFSQLLSKKYGDNTLDKIIDKFYSGISLNFSDGLYLLDNAPLPTLSAMALHKKREVSADNIFYNRNFHIEPTNICVYNCKFCSYRKPINSPQAWNMSVDDVLEYAHNHYTPSTTEIHLVGGVHPNATIESYAQVVSALHSSFPKVSIKAFSAIEHIYVYEKSGLTYEEGMKIMLESGMSSLTGGGAEIFDSQIRNKICPDKPSAQKWLALHNAAHNAGAATAATMLYGHLEKSEHIIDHMSKIRELQTKTRGFTTFIPLKYRSSNNSMSHLGESTLINDLRIMAVSRIFLDNVPHIKAYPPSLGIENSRLALLYGADDIDGTVNDTTKIYTMAGGDPLALTESALKQMCDEMGFKGVERDTFYNIIES